MKTSKGVIDWSKIQLLKWDHNTTSDLMLIRFNASTIGGMWPETRTLESAATVYVPHSNFFYARDQLKPLVARAMDWRFDAEIADRIQIVGLEQKMESALVSEIYISFVYRSQATGIRTTYKKGVTFSAHDGMKSSLDESEKDVMADFIEEIRLYASRQKGENNQLFDNDLTPASTHKVEVTLQKN